MIPRLKFYFSLTICVVLLTPGARASALSAPAPVYKEALEEHLKDAAHNEGAESIKHDKTKGEKVHQIESVTSDSNKNHYSKANDEGKYLSKDHDTKSSAEGDSYEGYNSKKDKAENSEASGFKRGHKKGHHKQGFQNSYHKDESSNKSTFFDDFNDEGDQAQYNSRLNNHDNQGGRSYHGSHNNGQEYVRDNHQGGGYIRNGENGNRHSGHQDHGKNYYADDRYNYNKFHDDRNRYDRNRAHDRHEFRAPPPPLPPPAPPIHHHHPAPGWDWQRWDDSRKGWEPSGWDRGIGWERDYGGPGYYDDRGFRHDGGYGLGPHHGYGYGYGESRPAVVAEIPRDIPKNAPIVAHRKQTITIYEDPRYDGTNKGNLRKEEGDYLQLEFKPSDHRYASYDTRDDTYYNVPAESSEARGMEASKVNRLVYNYRRQ